MYVFLTVNIIGVVLPVIQENQLRLRRVRLEVGLLRIRWCKDLIVVCSWGFNEFLQILLVGSISLHASCFLNNLIRFRHLSKLLLLCCCSLCKVDLILKEAIEKCKLFMLYWCKIECRAWLADDFQLHWILDCWREWSCAFTTSWSLSLLHKLQTAFCVIGLALVFDAACLFCFCFL